MEILVPVSMLGIGLVIGAIFLWFISRTKLKYEYDRARAEGETERATLVERLAGKDQQLQQLREAFDRESAQSDELRTESANTRAKHSALQTRIEKDRKAAQRKVAVLSNG